MLDKRLVNTYRLQIHPLLHAKRHNGIHRINQYINANVDIPFESKVEQILTDKMKQYIATGWCLGKILLLP